MITRGCAEEGDVRLVEQSEVANWQMGRLEVFFEGSWSQVCAAGFGGADADVACRQLGFGAGTVGHEQLASFQDFSFTPRDRIDLLVYPEIAVTRLDCTGSETSLLQCPGDMSRPDYGEPAGCFQDGDAGLVIACVAETEEGEFLGNVCLCYWTDAVWMPLLSDRCVRNGKGCAPPCLLDRAHNANAAQWLCSSNLLFWPRLTAGSKSLVLVLTSCFVAISPAAG